MADPWNNLAAAVWEQAMTDLLKGDVPTQLDALEFVAGYEGLYLIEFLGADVDAPFIMLSRLRKSVMALPVRLTSCYGDRIMQHMNMTNLFQGLTPDEARKLANAILVAANELRADLEDKRKETARDDRSV